MDVSDDDEIADACQTFGQTVAHEIEHRLRTLIPHVAHVEVEDVSTGNCAVSFAYGSNRSLNPRGLDLKLTVVSAAFEGLRLLEQHRLVNGALQSELLSGAIHSLPQLQTLTPAMWQARKQKDHHRWVAERLRTAIPDIEHLAIRVIDDGHAAAGFVDGSNRSLNPEGIQLVLTVVSASFDDKRLLQRHQMVSAALQSELASGAVHALPELKTWTPSQWLQKQSEREGEEVDPKRQRTTEASAPMHVDSKRLASL
eukprot:gnl/TRDRNA2_/TRDRNA2_159114_c0_seq1.p1 gnl/TRDRNA2_/TRDRNA2_159114_c0~~gnl/TRDRNA2_/TRDRNA2_159114_c0_seq1.p1  ORF type:complete len:255 (-),score=45.26 gnl/TRDRNA2_/TRDRNA2_159114_c0_seq1:90-854(-)